jgi:hypothetical protein
MDMTNENNWLQCHLSSSGRGRESFWETYLAWAEENRVRPDRSAFYVNWARDFANFLPEKPLKERTGKDIGVFLADLEKRRGMGAGTVGTCQCCHHHDLHARTEQARTLSKEPGGYLKNGKVMIWSRFAGEYGLGVHGIEHYQKRVGASR